MSGDKLWLRDNLVKALGWDALVAEEVVEAITAAQSQQERDDLVQVRLSWQSLNNVDCAGPAEEKQLGTTWSRHYVKHLHLLLQQGYLGGGSKVKALVDKFVRGAQLGSQAGASNVRGREVGATKRLH